MQISTRSGRRQFWHAERVLFSAERAYSFGTICQQNNPKKKESAMPFVDLPSLTMENFEEEVLNSTLPVLVDFTAEWCGPCKMLDPQVAQLAKEWEGKVKVFQLDVDKAADLAARLRVLGVPTLALFIDGKMVARMTGYKPKKGIIKKFSKYLSL